MVNVFTKFINIRKTNMTAADLTDSLIQSPSAAAKFRCSKCESPNLKFWCHYTRKITDIEKGKIIDFDLKTKRYKCSSCCSTHAFLVPLVVPYSRHSILYMLTVLLAYFYRTNTVIEICDKYEITPQTLYNWKKLFFKHKEEWLGYLTAAETGNDVFILKLLDDCDYSEFSRQFMANNPGRMTFMQSHKNADNHRYV